MTFKEIDNIFHKYSTDFLSLPEEDRSLFWDSLKQIDEADKRINPMKYEKSTEEELALYDKGRKYVVVKNSGLYDPDSIMDAIEKGDGEYFGH
jgi:hypothetical protein